MISPGVSHHPARKGDQGEAHCLETLAHPLSAPLHRRAQVEGQHRYGPPCGVGSEQPRREPARSQVTLQDAVDLLAFTASLPVPPDRLISRKVSVGHQPGDLVPGSAGQPHHGEGQFQLQFHSRQRLFAQHSDEPVFRVLLAVGYPVWYEVHLRPLLTCLDPGGAQSAVRGMPVLFGHRVIGVNYFCRCASIIFAGRPSVEDASELPRSDSWGRRTPRWPSGGRSCQWQLQWP